MSPGVGRAGPVTAEGVAGPVVSGRARRVSPAIRLAAVLALAMASPILAILAVLVGADVGRPVFFRQERVGQGGRVFTIVKFRTMREAFDSGGRALADSERVTRIGRALRRLRLDELPQLLAIAAGVMAAIGPRPLLPETIRSYGDIGQDRCLVPPGLTGWAQVSGNTLLSDDEKLALDLWYIDHRTASLDLQILLETVTTFVFGERRRPERIGAAQAYLAVRRAPS